MDKDKIDEMCKEYRTIFKARKKELEKYTFVTHETAMTGFEFFTAIFEQIMECNKVDDSEIERIIISHSSDLITIFKRANISLLQDVIYDPMENGNYLYQVKRRNSGVLEVNRFYTPSEKLSSDEYIRKMLNMYIDLISKIAEQLSFPSRLDCLSVIDDTILIESRAKINPDDKEAMDRNSKNLNILRMIRRAILYYYK